MRRGAAATLVGLLGVLVVPWAVGAAYEEAPVPGAGALAGVVRFVGAPPALPPLSVNKNRDVCGDQKPSEVLVVGADGGVKGGVILIEGITRGKKPAHEVVIDNRECVFVPHVAATMIGAPVRVRNSDPILHSTHGFQGRPTIFNLALPNKGQVIDVTRRFRSTGAVRVLCDAHTHMSAWLVMHDSPYLAVTDVHGAFRIDGVPPGTWRVTLWHQGFRRRGVDKDGRPLYDEPATITKDVTIVPRATATVEFELR